MKLPVRVCLSVLAVGSLFAFAGCGDDDDSMNANAGGAPSHAGSASGGASDAAIECEVIGELCHEFDTGSGPGHECHELGHQGVAATCAKEFAGCVQTCVPEAGGSAGAGSAPDPRCAALGELCHEVDDQTGPLHDCHEVGHEGVAAKCATEFDSCATQCLAARELLEAGAGGSGGAGAGGVTSAGGAENAGAGGVVSVGGVSSGGAGARRNQGDRHLA